MVGFGGKVEGALVGLALFLKGGEPEVVLEGMRGDRWSSSGSRLDLCKPLWFQKPVSGASPAKDWP